MNKAPQKIAQLISLTTAVALSQSAFAQNSSAVSSSPQNSTSETKKNEETIRRLEARIDELEKNTEERLNFMADAVEAQVNDSHKSKVHFGGYGELHYSNLDVNGTDYRELDMARFVLFTGYDFNDHIRFVSELEVEHTLVSSGSRGAVELEQAYIEIDLQPNMHLKTGVILMPIGITNETHEPPTFYGVKRPVVETSIIPTTWYSAGMSFNHQFDSGWSYDLMVSEGLKTDDPTATPGADPFDLKAGKQKGSFSAAYDLALTGRVAYRGIRGLEVAAYAQQQPDLDQSARNSYAEGATLLGCHVVYQLSDFTAKALYARWDLDGDAAKNAGKDVQAGGYVELDWQPLKQWGAFVRQSAWSQMQDVDANQTDLGINYYPHPDVVFKGSYQLQNDDAGNSDGFYLGMGYQF